jgi:hypothetical protein
MSSPAVKYHIGVRSSEVSIPGMAFAALICLVATGIALSQLDRFGPLALALFAIAGLVFYISVAMPIRFKRPPSSRD